MHDLDRTEMASFEYDFESESEGEGDIFSEAEIAELASELMGIGGERELEQFLGDLIKKAASAAGSFIKSPAGKALGGMLKGAAKQALPSLGGALGGWIGGDEGANLGSQLAGLASDKLGLEFEGENQEFETAKDFVRMAGAAAAKVAGAPRSDNLANVVRSSVTEAIQSYMPAILKPAANTARTAQGRWIRRGSRIVLLGV